MLERWTKKRIIITALLLIASTALIAGYTSYLATTIRDEQKNLALHGVVVKAKITEMRKQRHGYDYQMIFEYDRKPYTNTLRAFYYKLGIGDSLKLKIDPKNPTGYCDYAYPAAR